MTDNQIQLNEDFKMISLEQSKAWYEAFAKFSKEILKEGLDYGKVPGVSKPSLFKPGAEKLSLVYAMQPEMECTDKQIDLDTGFIMFTYRCNVKTKGGLYRGACEGSCNSYEKKYLFKKDGSKTTPEERINLINTIQKMAQKRAYVGAVLIATGASEFFTQDVEDMGIVATDDSDSGTSKSQQPAVSDIDLSLLVMPFGKAKSDEAKQVGFVTVTINQEQAKQCGFNWNDQYDKNGKKYVLQAKDQQMLALIIDPESMKTTQGYQLSKLAKVQIEDTMESTSETPEIQISEQ